MTVMHDLSVTVRHGDGRLGLQVGFTTPYTYEDVNWQGSSFCMFVIMERTLMHRTILYVTGYRSMKCR